MTCFTSVQPQDFLPGSMLFRPTVRISLPVIKLPRSVKRTYSDSEIASAAVMLEKLRKRERELPGRLDQDRVLDEVVDKLIDQLE